MRKEGGLEPAPHMGLPVKRVSRPGVELTAGRCAQPRISYRAAFAGGRDWLPMNADHCITSYPVGAHWPVPKFRMHAVRSHGAMGPIYKIGCCMSAQGRHG